MYTAYYCEKCKKPFAKVGAFKEKTPCTHCESKNTISNAEFVEKEKKEAEKEEKKK